MSRQILLPNFLSDPKWSSLVDAIDVVFKPAVDDPVRWLSAIRHHYILNDTCLEKIESGLMVSENDLDVFDSAMTVQNSKLSGIDVPGEENFSTGQLQRILREVATFWYSKGTEKSVDFLSYVLNTQISMENLWTEDYVSFYPEGDPTIGIPLYSGGTWYPTTHVQFTLDPSGLLSIPLGNLVGLFNALNNYNLVIGAVGLEVIFPIVQQTQSVQPPLGGDGQPAVALRQFYEIEITIPSA